MSFNWETVQLQNILTGQLYSKDIFESLITVEQLRNNLFDEFGKERMTPESEKNVFDPIKGSFVKTFASSNNPLKIDSTPNYWVKGELQFIRPMCNQSKIKNIDIRTVIGEHELTNVPLNLWNLDGSLVNGGDGKSSTVNQVLNFANVKPLLNFHMIFLFVTL